MNIKFSKSRYELMKECLGKYYFNYILKKRDFKEILWPGTIYGTSIHSYIENNIKGISSKKDIKALPPFRETFYSEKKKALEENKNLEYKTPRGFVEPFFIDEADKWSKKILEFLLNYLPKGELILEEEWNESIEIEDVTIDLNGIIDLQVVGKDKIQIFDFKNTKNPAGYYYVDWNNDPQSLVYLHLRRMHSPDFSYFVFDIENSLIIVKSRDERRENDELSLRELLIDFKMLHGIAHEEKYYSPSEFTCKWCKWRDICPKKI